MTDKGVSRRVAMGTMAAAGAGFGATAGCAAETPAPMPDGGYSIPASRFGVSPDASPSANAQSLQQAIDASYGRRLVLDVAPGGIVRFDRTLTVEPALHNNLGLEIAGYGVNGYIGTVLQNVGRGDGIAILNRTGGNWDGPCVLRGFGLHGDIKATAGGSGIRAHRINGGLRFEDLWMDGHATHALHLEHCYGIEIVRGFYIRSRLSNIMLAGPSNNVVLRHARAFAAGRTLGGEHANIDIAASVAEPAAGVVLDACDVSYAGREVRRTWGSMSGGAQGSTLLMPGTLLAGGERVAMPLPELGLATSRPLAVGRARGTETGQLDCAAGACPEGAAGGAVFPFASGVRLRGVLGLTCTGLYIEDCVGAGVALEDCRGFSIVGGLMQNAAIRVAASTSNGMIAGMCFRGARAGVRVEGGARADIRIDPSNAMVDGARLEIA